ncbi:MAG: hypothetical protein IJN65_06190 [Clostridia bacterium]|nr:hypothetical protein [Clostridia bacterium]
MKKTKNIAFCAICAAIISVIMLLGYIPNLTYTVPAVAGLVLLVVLIEANLKYTIATYVVSAIISFFIAEIEVKILFILLFGVYPWLKSIIEKIKNIALSFVVKILYFNVSAAVFYVIITLLTGINLFGSDIKTTLFTVLFLIAANFVFLLYDFALTRLSTFYIIRLHGAVNKLLR